MKRIIISATSIILLATAITVMVVSCDKETISKTTDNQEYAGPPISSIDFSPYYQEVEKLSMRFWTACDDAYNKHPQEFMQICEENDFEAFQRLTCLNQDFFEHFTAALLQARTKVEADYPGISLQYGESPCAECAEKALTRVGHVVDTLQGNSAQNLDKMENRDCWFVCSLSCMATMELYVPCVLACVKICKKYMRNW